MYDIIGDIHGHKGQLAELLECLGYDRRRGHYGQSGISSVTCG